MGVRLAALTLCGVLAAACGRGDPDVAFVGVDVLPMDRERILRDQTLLLRAGRVAALGPRSSVPVPRGAHRIDGRGGTVLPGLADMHVHLQHPARLSRYLAHGVTTVRSMRGETRDLDLRERVRRGELRGPRLVLGGPHLDGRGPEFPGRRVVRGAEDARRVVREHREQGFDFLKVYSGLSEEAYAALADEAARVGLPVAGHVPLAVGLEGVLASGQRSIEHVEEYTRTHPFLFEVRRIPEVARRTREAGVWVCPTLSTYRAFGPRAEVFQRFHTELVRGLHEAGVPLLLGTDAEGYEEGGAVPVRELLALRDAGLSSFEALAAATRNAGRFLAGDPDAGTLVPGAPGDLLLVDGRPLDDLGVLARPRWVCARGRCFEPSALERGSSARAGR